MSLLQVYITISYIQQQLHDRRQLQKVSYRKYLRRRASCLSVIRTQSWATIYLVYDPSVVHHDRYKEYVNEDTHFKRLKRVKETLLLRHIDMPKFSTLLYRNKSSERVVPRASI